MILDSERTFHAWRIFPTEFWNKHQQQHLDLHCRHKSKGHFGDLLDHLWEVIFCFLTVTISCKRITARRSHPSIQIGYIWTFRMLLQTFVKECGELGSDLQFGTERLLHKRKQQHLTGLMSGAKPSSHSGRSLGLVITRKAIFAWLRHVPELTSVPLRKYRSEIPLNALLKSSQYFWQYVSAEQLRQSEVLVQLQIYIPHIWFLPETLWTSRVRVGAPQPQSWHVDNTQVSPVRRAG